MAKTLNDKVKKATMWSLITEVVAKLVAPISTMVLARLLTPEAFGVLVTATMVITFAEIFTDAGFQKYLIQKDFKTKEDLYDSANVAFWSNLCVSIVIWLIIVVFSSDIARLAGNDGYGFVVSVSCVCIPFAAFSSIQMAILKRAFDFKTLFGVRIVGILIPLVVTIPIAYFTRSYWALIIGMIVKEGVNALILTFFSEFKPKLRYDFSLFKNMFSFTVWSMIEAVSIWLTSYLDVFIVGTMLSTYYMGIYRTSMGIVSQIVFIITASTTPILFSALSRLQDDMAEFRKMFLNFQRIVSMLIIPMGVGIFMFSESITKILLGEAWSEAANFIGWWGLTSSVTIVFSHYASEIYRSLGKPKLSVLSQFLHLIVLIPVVYIAIGYGFDTLVLCRSLVRFQMILVNAIILWIVVRISFFRMLYNCKAAFVSTFAMFVVWWVLPTTDVIWLSVCQMLLCAVVNVTALCCFRNERLMLVRGVKGVCNKILKRKD